jgi:hypothetical protein
MTLSRAEKLDLMRSLNWDYHTSCEDMLDIIDGHIEAAGAFDRKKLFVRSLERLGWTYIVALWGIETMKELYTPELRRRIFPPSRRDDYDFAFAVLREEPLPATGWGTERARALQRTFLSERWNRTKPGVL